MPEERQTGATLLTDALRGKWLRTHDADSVVYRVTKINPVSCDIEYFSTVHRDQLQSHALGRQITQILGDVTATQEELETVQAGKRLPYLD